jgi:GNAT superfamily N-acetyltransferase
MNTTQLRDLYDEHMRKNSWVLAFDKHLEPDASRYVAHNGEAALLMWHHFGASGEALNARVDAELAWFKARSKSLNWKVYGHDHPPGLGELLEKAGGTSDDHAVLHMASVADVCARLASPALNQIALQAGSTRADVMRAKDVWVNVWPESANEQAVWGEVYAGALDKLDRSKPETHGAQFWTAADPQHPTQAAAAGYMIHGPGTPIALLCGGAVRQEARKQGLYKALLKARAEWAHSRGATHIAIEASPMSAPIVQSLGFAPITTLVFYKFAF